MSGGVGIVSDRGVKSSGRGARTSGSFVKSFNISSLLFPSLEGKDEGGGPFLLVVDVIGACTGICSPTGGKFPVIGTRG